MARKGDTMKLTELGWLPIDWNVVKLGEVSDIDVRSIDHTNMDFHFYYISLENVKEGQISYGDKISLRNAPSRARRTLRPNDILFGTVRPKLKSHAIFKLEPASEFVASTGFAVIQSGAKIHYEFGFQLIMSDEIARQVDMLIVGSNYPAISNNQVSNLLIPLPPKPEQEAIAKVLSDTDALIESLEKLIEKKKLIKKGVMQDLLSGKKRLPGFSEPWVEKSLGELGTTFGGLSGKSKLDFGAGDAQYITFMNIINNPIIDVTIFDNVRVSPDEQQNKVLRGDILFNGSSETPEEVGMCSYYNGNINNVYLNSFSIGFRPDNLDHVNGLFFCYLLRSSVGRNKMKKMAQGATRYNLSKENLKRVRVHLPGIEEQNAICSIIANLDYELTTISAKVSKTRLLKQGLMQQLLTGKIRLAP